MIYVDNSGRLENDDKGSRRRNIAYDPKIASPGRMASST
jgi:hypothetical protein